jgi:hypothetical protein
VYLILVILGITNSNIGVPDLREDPAAPTGVQIGASQSIRSDEWGTESPIWLGQMARGGAEDSTPLSVSNDFFAQLPTGPVSAVVFFDGTALALGRWIPHEMLFAAKWWLPSLMLFIGLPVMFRQITGRIGWGYLAAILTFFAPATMWWSGRPVNTIGFVSAGCALAIYASRRVESRQWMKAALAYIFAGVLLARTPTYYQPLAIVVAVPIVVATAIVILFERRTWSFRLISLGSIVVSGAFWTTLLFLENAQAISAGLTTVYPGDRASTGGPVSVGMLFGATNLGWLEGVGTSPTVNQSEIASAFTVLLIVVGFLFVATRWRGGRVHGMVTSCFAAFGVFWLSWAMVDWGSVGSAIPLINRVPNTRAMMGVGYIAILAFCFFISQWRPPRRFAVALVPAGAAALVSGYAGSSLGVTEMPGLSTWMIWVSAAVTGTVIFLLIRYPNRWWSLAIAALAAVSLTFSSTPIVVGLGDLRSSDTAQKFIRWGEESRADGTVWASTSQDVDSLMMATGVPALSTRQQIGPDADAWKELDPTGRYEDMWNRGGLHVTFEWADSDEIRFSLPVGDTVVVSTSPCTLAQDVPSFGYAVSQNPLSFGCLSEVDTFSWDGHDFTVYAVNR